MHWRFLLLSTFLAALLAARVVHSALEAAADPVFPETITYSGQIEETSNPTWNSHGGSIVLTFDSNLRLVRAELSDFVLGIMYYSCSPCVPEHEALVDVDRVVHQNIMASDNGGMFFTSLPYIEVSRGYSNFTVTGTVDKKGASGILGMSCLDGPCLLDASFTATEVVDKPPADNDTIVVAGVESGGTITLSLDGGDHITAMALDNVWLAGCSLDRPLNVIAFSDPPGAGEVYARVGNSAVFAAASRSGAEWVGTLRYRSSIYDECNDLVRWSTAGFAAASPTVLPQITPTSSAPALPATGQQNERGNRLANLLVGLLALGAVSMTAWGLRRP